MCLKCLRHQQVVVILTAPLPGLSLQMIETCSKQPARERRVITRIARIDQTQALGSKCFDCKGCGRRDERAVHTYVQHKKPNTRSMIARLFSRDPQQNCSKSAPTDAVEQVHILPSHTPPLIVACRATCHQPLSRPFVQRTRTKHSMVVSHKPTALFSTLRTRKSP